MSRLTAILRDFAITLWAGGLWAIGYLVAPLLFRALTDNRALAGALAGRMFSGIAWVGIVCGSFLLLYEMFIFRGGCLKRPVFWLVLLMSSLTLIMQFWMQPFVAALRASGAPVAVLPSSSMRNFALWHGVSSALYLLNSLLALVLVLKSRRS